MNNKPWKITVFVKLRFFKLSRMKSEFSATLSSPETNVLGVTTTGKAMQTSLLFLSKVVLAKSAQKVV